MRVGFVVAWLGMCAVLVSCGATAGVKPAARHVERTPSHALVTTSHRQCPDYWTVPGPRQLWADDALEARSPSSSLPVSWALRVELDGDSPDDVLLAALDLAAAGEESVAVAGAVLHLALAGPVREAQLAPLYRFGSLDRLDLTKVTSITPAALQHVVRSASIRHIALPRSADTHPDELLRELLPMVELEVLELHHPRHTKPALCELARFPRLHAIRIAATMDDEVLRALAQCRELRVLEAAPRLLTPAGHRTIRPSPITDDGLHALATLPHLIAVRLAVRDRAVCEAELEWMQQVWGWPDGPQPGVSSAGVEALLRKPTVRRLHIARMANVDGMPPRPYYGSVMSYAETLRLTREVVGPDRHVCGFGPTGTRGFEEEQRLTCLSRLTTWWYRYGADQDWREILVPELPSYFLQRNLPKWTLPLTDEHDNELQLRAEVLDNWRGALRVKEILMSPPLAERLVELSWRPHPAQLNVPSSRGRPASEDCALRLLARAPMLERLEVRSIPVRDHVMPFIAALPNLQHVALERTKVSQDAVDALATQRPEVQVEYRRARHAEQR